jgi:GntR family transcriptional regulator
MSREIRYQRIADELRERITDGRWAAGRVLPSEADLGSEFGVSRVTVRRALEVLRDEGSVDARQGFGWFVARSPLRQDLGRLGTIEAQLERSGIGAQRQVIEFELVAATGRVREVLGSGRVVRVKRVNLADGEPFAVVTVWCPADLGGGLSVRDVEESSFYDLLGISLSGAVQTIGADAADSNVARLLRVPLGSPVLRCERTTHSLDGRAVLFAEHVFPAHRTEFVVELPEAEPSIAPSGLRLVDERQPMPVTTRPSGGRRRAASVERV